MTSSVHNLFTEPAGRGYLYAEKTAGTFVNDFEYSKTGTGTLDEYNGRYAKTRISQTELMLYL